MPALINSVGPQPELIIHTDGGSRGNPGPSAIGVVIFTPDKEHLESFGEYIGTTTNNQAEYKAVIAGLKAANKYNAQKITFNIDSELVVRQLNGRYRVKNPELKPLFEQVHSLIKGVDVSFHHVTRENNQLADIEVNKALDQAR
ncbi:MAG TPA: ribonuclease HI family protein [Candidatus Dormibacteraeota bacterium]|nr:ribonuclease HI family protein [Candidatus Dormibacteraeota bacterium]